MQIKVNPEELLSEEAIKTAKDGAKRSRLPFEIYIFRAYDQMVSANKHGIDIVRSDRPEEETEEVEEAEFDHLGLSTRPYNVVNEFFRSIEEVVATPADELLDLQGMGEKSFNELVDKLIEHDYISSKDDLGKTFSTGDRDLNANPPSVDHPEEEVEAQEEEAQEEEAQEEHSVSWHSKLRDLTPDTENVIKRAAIYYARAWGKENETAFPEVRDLIGDVYDKNDPDTIPITLSTIHGHMPVTDSQISSLQQAAEEIGESSSQLAERALASCGKEWDGMTFSDAHNLLMELEEESNNAAMMVDEDFFV